MTFSEGGLSEEVITKRYIDNEKHAKTTQRVSENWDLYQALLRARNNSGIPYVSYEEILSMGWDEFTGLFGFNSVEQ